MHCPKDKAICRTKQLDDIEIDVCPECDGVWIEKGEVQKLNAKLEVPKYTNIDEVLAKWEVSHSGATIPKDFWTETALVCPRHHGHMTKHYFGGTQIGVDQCQECEGFWLDGGELQAIAKLAEPNPDFEKAWQMLLQDEIDSRNTQAQVLEFPAKIAHAVSNPYYGLFLVGDFLMKLLIKNNLPTDPQQESN